FKNIVCPANFEIQKLKEETEQMMTAGGQICSQILDKQRKGASLESDCRTLTQALELVHQERVRLSAKLVEKSTYYAKVAEDIAVKFQQLNQMVKGTFDEEKVAAGADTIRSHAPCTVHREVMCYKNFHCGLLYLISNADTFVARGKSNHLVIDNMNNEASKELIFSVDSATAKLDEIKRTKANLAAENSARIEQMKSQSNEFHEELRAMDVKTFEKEQKALLADIVGETEFLQSLQNQIEKLKGISQLVKCTCGQEYKIELDACV
ncbi:uncharacterized protein LOC115681679, partial [Syzygium oleosum]|uniref:uncharacterized protein LOC115681679 n=1 Tax=Syzygium oleosum TaxID=219896 RepID=UPI0024BA8486